VVKDPGGRSCRAGTKRVVAVGTQFSVRRDDNDIRVVVTRGPFASKPQVPRLARGGGFRTALTAGTIAHASDAMYCAEDIAPQAEEI